MEPTLQDDRTRAATRGQITKRWLPGQDQECFRWA